MNRTTAAALIAAGVVGLVGGTVSAVVRGDSSPGTAGPAGGKTPDKTPGKTEQPQPTAQVLYAADGKIHDGKRTISWTAPFEAPQELVRTSTGYLLSFADDHEDPTVELWTVDTQGRSEQVADVRGRWDLDADLSSIAGTDAATGKVTVWPLDGTPKATWRSFTSPVAPVWAGDVVLVAPERDRTFSEISWDPTTGATKDTKVAGYTNLTASPDGRFVGGTTGTDGLPTSTGGDYCLASHPTKQKDDTGRWATCDWRSNEKGIQYSPGSTKVIAIPSESDGFGPGLFGIFSAEKGPRGGITEIDAPDATMGAEWLDDEHLLVYGATDLDLDENTGMWIREYTLDGESTEVVRIPQGRLVVATTK